MTAQSGDYTFVSTDSGQTVEATGATAQTFTVPLNAIPFGAEPITVTLTGTGGVTVTAPAGVSLESAVTPVQLSTPFTSLTLSQRRPNEWVVDGVNDLVVSGSPSAALVPVVQPDGTIAWGVPENPSYVPLGGTTQSKVTGPVTFRTPATVRGRVTTINPLKARSRNALSALTVPSVDGTGENVEPCVLYLPDGITDQHGATWRYLMVKAGYHNTDSSLENPDLVVSNDGQTWAHIAGCPSPLVAKPSYGNNFDQSITVGPDGTLYVLYMDTDTTTTDKTYYITCSPTTTGGTTYDFSVWSSPVTLLTNSSIGTEREQAPVAQWDGTQWHVWTVQLVPANPSGIIHYTGASIAAALAGTGVACTINNQPATPTVLWEHNIIRIGEIWVGVITAKTGVNSVLYFMTSPDGATWTMGTKPLLQPMALGQGALWDRGTIYRSTVVLLDTGRGGIRFGLWYGGATVASGAATWGIGYTEIWFADAEAPREAHKYGAAASRWYVNPIVTALTSGALTQNNMYVYVAYSGEVGLLINGLDLTVASAVASAVMRAGLYIANNQDNPYFWASGTAWGTLVSEAASTFDGNSATHQGVIRWAGTQNLWVPPRTWFGIAGASQGAAINIQQGKILNTGFSPFGASGAGYNNTPAVCLFCTGVTGALPQVFTPTGVGQVDNGIGYLLDSTQPS